MTDIEFDAMGKRLCSSLAIVLKNEGILGGPHSASINYDSNGNILHIEIEQCLVRNITISTDSTISMSSIWRLYNAIEKLLMMFDGRFYTIETLAFSGDGCSEDEYVLYANECLSRRLVYYKTDSAYCYSDHVFLMYDTVLTPELIARWIQLQEELDIVHQVALHNISATGITHDVKCANLIECLEPMVEIINIYDKFFPNLKPGDRTTTLKMCIDAVISKYGNDIFAEEYGVNKDRFLQTLVNTRNRIMHIKRNQPVGKYLTAPESILYLVKFFHLYRVVILSLLGIKYKQYKSCVVKSVEQWNAWNNVLTNFKTELQK